MESVYALTSNIVLPYVLKSATGRNRPAHDGLGELRFPSLDLIGGLHQFHRELPRYAGWHLKDDRPRIGLAFDGHI
jgi:hypothetical protein